MSSSEHVGPQGNSEVENTEEKSSSVNDRLFALRMKINQSRKANRDETEEEYKRLTHKRSRKSNEAVEEGDDDLQFRTKQKRGIAASEEGLLQQSAEEAAWESEKRRKKVETAATYGLNAFTSDASHRAYEKRVRKLATDAEVKQDSKRNQQSSVSLSDNPLEYGKVNTAVSQEALDRLSRDVAEREAQRKKYHRHRVGEDGGDVDYINEKNRKFNKQLRSAFDKYTVEIRQNLERGTAL